MYIGDVEVKTADGSTISFMEIANTIAAMKKATESKQNDLPAAASALLRAADAVEINPRVTRRFWRVG